MVRTPILANAETPRFVSLGGLDSELPDPFHELLDVGSLPRAGWLRGNTHQQSHPGKNDQ
jgi:hypothetical protein